MPMNVVNVMWSGGAPYMSVHKVHRQMLCHVAEGAEITNWLLLGDGLCCGEGAIREWHMPPRTLKGRSFWRWLTPVLRHRLYKALQQTRPDVLLLDGMGVARLVLPLMRHFPETRVTVLFHGSTRMRGSDIRLLRAVEAHRLSIAAVSRTLAQALEQALGRSVDSLRVALDPQVFGAALFERDHARRLLAIVQRPGPVFGAVGRLVESKGFEMLIEAFAQVHRQQPDARMVILGDGELRARLNARIQALGLGDSVQLCGYRPDLSQLYRAFDWLLVPSRSEGLGMVLQEAVLADVPVLCSDLPVFREQLGQAGRYLPVGDQAAWARAIGECKTLSVKETAARQRDALDPEQAWQAFSQGSRALLRG